MSKFFALNLRDLLKAVVLVFITAIVTGAYELINTGADLFSWVVFKPVLVTSALTALSYLIKNLFTNSAGEPLKTEPPAKPLNT